MGDTETNITLKSRGETILARSKRGIVMLVLDDTVKGIHTYKSKTVQESYSDSNKAIITKCFTKYGVNTVKVICFDSASSETLSTALDKLDKIKFNYMAVPGITSDTDKKLVGDFIINQRKASNILTHVILNCYAGDHEGIINFKNKSVTMDSTLTGDEYCVDVACQCATNAIDVSMTGKTAPGVTAVSMEGIDDFDTVVDAGGFFIYYDDDLETFVFSRAVNSKTTIGTGENEQLKKIRCCEILDMMRDDEKIEWKTNFRGKNSNSYDDRCNLITKYNTYLSTLMSKKYLNNSPSYASLVKHNVEKCKEYLQGKGVDTSSMTELEILSADFGTHVFLDQNVYVLDSMEDLDLGINY